MQLFGPGWSRKVPVDCPQGSMLLEKFISVLLKNTKLPETFVCNDVSDCESYSYSGHADFLPHFQQEKTW